MTDAGIDVEISTGDAELRLEGVPLVACAPSYIDTLLGVLEGDVRFDLVEHLEDDA